MKKSGSRLRNRIKFLTAVSILSIILAIIAIASCFFIITYGFINFNKQSSKINTSDITEDENNTEINEEATDDFDKIDDEPDVNFDDNNYEDVSNTLEQLVSDATNSKNISAEKLLYDIKNALAQGDSTTSVLRKLFPDDVVVNISNGYTFFPIDKSLKLNEKDDEIDFSSSDLFKGIDVSRYQGEIDWEAVSKDNIDYAIIRLGNRGYSEGGLILDDTFNYNIEEAQKNKVSVGVYFFTQATSDEEAIEEAEFVIEHLKEYKIQWPVYLDVEYIDGSKRGDTISVEDRTQYCVTFLNRVKNAGYNVGIYGNLKTFITMVDMARLQNYDIWYAAYTHPVYFPYHYDMLQYSEKGNVSGIKSTVDVNVSWKKYE